MRIRVFGQMQVHDGTNWKHVSAAKRRSVLAALVVRSPQLVSATSLTDAVWAGSPPPNARTQIQGYVLQLRRGLGDRAGELLATGDGGYRLRVEPGHVDATLFQRKVEVGCDAARRGAMDLAQRELVQALDLWVGEPFEEVPENDSMQAYANHLNGLRLRALETKLEAQLELGMAEDVIHELHSLVAEHPLREHLWCQLMTALYRADRPAEALDAYQRMRRLLADELGSDPGEAATALHESILRRTLPTNRRAATGQQAPARQLPPQLADYTGRVELIEEVTSALTAEPTGAPNVVVLHGLPGAGKTALAVQSARAVAEHFPDAQVKLDVAASSAQPRSATELAGEVLRAFGVEGAAIPPELEQRSAALRSALVGHRALIVLDDAGDADQVLPLLPPDGTAAVLVTTRHYLTEIPGARHIEVGAMPDHEALALLSAIVGQQRVCAELDEATTILGYCGGLPLSIRIVGGRLLARPTWPLRHLSRRLEDESRRLGELRLGRLDVRASVDASLDLLSEDAERAFELVGLLGPQDFPGWVVSAVLEHPDSDAVLDVLVDANLLTSLGPDSFGEPRYRLHDLLRVRAVERSRRRDPDALRPAVQRVLSSWLWLLDRARAASSPSLFDPLLGSSPRRPANSEVGRDVALDPLGWCVAERGSLLAAIELADRYGFSEECWELAAGMAPFFDDQARYDDWRHSHQVGLDSPSTSDLGRAVLLRALGQVHVYHDEFDQALDAGKQALLLFDRVADGLGVALACAGLATVHRLTGDPCVADEWMDRALTGVAAHRPRSALDAQLRSGKGRILMAQGKSDDALAWLAESLEIAREVGDRHREAVILQIDGSVRRQQGDLPAAGRALESALVILRDLNDERCQGDTLFHLGEVQLDAGDRCAAAALFESALTIFERRHISDRETECRDLLRQLRTNTR